MGTAKKNQETLFKSGESCTFCRIIKKEEEAYVLFEDSKTIAFLDLKPLFPGHMLLVPKEHYANIMEIPEQTIGPLFNNVKRLSLALEDSLGAEGEFIAVNNKVSQSVPHMHIHIVPRKFKDGLKGFFWPRYRYNNKEEILRVQEKIVSALKTQTD